MRLSWHDLGTPRADKANGKTVENRGLAGHALLPAVSVRSFPA